MASTGRLSPGTGTQIAGAGNNWNNPGNIVSDNAAEATCSMSNGAFTDLLYGKSFNASVPSTATIDGIKVYLKHRGSGSGMEIGEFWLINASGDTFGTAKSLSPVPTTVTETVFGDTTDLWGATLTPAIVNDTDFGAAVTYNNPSGSSRTARVEHLEIEIFYTAPPGLIAVGGAGAAAFVGTGIQRSSLSSVGVAALTALATVFVISTASISASASSSLAGTAVEQSVVDSVTNSTADFIGVELQVGQLNSAGEALVELAGVSDIPLITISGDSFVSFIGKQILPTGLVSAAAAGTELLGATILPASLSVVAAGETALEGELLNTEGVFSVASITEAVFEGKTFADGIPSNLHTARALYEDRNARAQVEIRIARAPTEMRESRADYEQRIGAS